LSKSYLDRLSLSPEERTRLADLGAAAPVAVLGIRRAAPDAFDRLFGPARAAEIAEQLEALLSEQDRAVLTATPGPHRPLGARLEEPPPARRGEGESS
jgi:hypothetical protein